MIISKISIDDDRTGSITRFFCIWCNPTFQYDDWVLKRIRHFFHKIICHFEMFHGVFNARTLHDSLFFTRAQILKYHWCCTDSYNRIIISSSLYPTIIIFNKLISYRKLQVFVRKFIALLGFFLIDSSILFCYTIFRRNIRAVPLRHLSPLCKKLMDVFSISSVFHIFLTQKIIHVLRIIRIEHCIDIVVFRSRLITDGVSAPVFDAAFASEPVLNADAPSCMVRTSCT